MNSSTKQVRPLKIFNASAGSGKTYSLVKSYLKLLLKDGSHPSRFGEIIAMTFTNKAALEMKIRIIKALNELSYPKIYGKKSDDYAIEIGNELGVNPEEIHQRSSKLLKTILHQYEDFNVMTIDKFNLRLIRSFSRDLDIAHDFDIILNEDVILEQIVDQLLNDLGNNPELTKLAFKYAESKIDDGEGWNFRRQLIEFSKILTKEKNFGQLDRLAELDFSIENYKTLKFEAKEILDSFISKCKEAYTIVKNSGIVTADLPTKSRLGNRIDKLNTYTEFPSLDKGVFTEQNLESIEKENTKGEYLPHTVQQALLGIHDEYLSLFAQYSTYQLYLKNYFNMALLKFLSSALSDVKSKEHLIRISEFNALITNLVANEDAPFIYERLGTRFKHFLLDEFQDTSRLQWLNMTPLVFESIANNNENLIVGDPKQSIYRFKNGVAEQFVALPGLYNPEENSMIASRSAYFQEMGEVENLEDNWRSATEIVNFNNQFFDHLRKKLPSNLAEFYDSVHQNPKANKTGYVKMVSAKIDKKELEINEFQQLKAAIVECEKDGFKRGDICILGTRNYQCSDWANQLINEGFKVVSVDSLSMESDPNVRMLLKYMRLRLFPNEQNEMKQFAEAYCQVKELSIEHFRSYFKTIEKANGKSYTLFSSQEFIRDHFENENSFYFKYESLYDFGQQSFQLFELEELKNPYLHHFADLLHSFEQKIGPDIQYFLDNYNADKSNLSVQIPESDDAIKIMTIHKSKGLEFPVVIIPSIRTLGANPKGSFLIPTEDFLLYSELTKSSPNATIKAHLESEINSILLDNVNLLYVGMTRPESRLYLFNYFDSKGFAEYVNELFSDLYTSNETELLIESGSKSKYIQPIDSTKDVFFEPIPTSDLLWFPDIALIDKEELKSEIVLSDEQRFGNQFHDLVSEIHSKEEIPSVISKGIQTGNLEIQFKKQLSQELNELFNNETYTSLFSNAIDILDEQSIIISEAEELRPDKIILHENATYIIDYKTGVPNSKHQKQVETYKHALENLGFKNVSCYLYYTSLKELRLIA